MRRAATRSWWSSTRESESESESESERDSESESERHSERHSESESESESESLPPNEEGCNEELVELNTSNPEL